MENEKLLEAHKLLQESLKRLASSPTDAVLLAAASKAFESTFEYCWKAFKKSADAAGLEVYSPRDALKAAAQLGLIASLETWNEYLNARNLSVHDYIGLDDKATYQLITRFSKDIHKLLLKEWYPLVSCMRKIVPPA